MVVAVTSSSKVIPGKSGDAEVRQWKPPQVRPAGGRDVSTDEVAAGGLLTADQLDQLQKQAYEEGYEAGRKEGFDFGHREALEAGRKLMQERVSRLDSLLQTLDQPLKELDDQVERELLDLVVATVRQLVRREVRTDPNQIIGVLREALSILPVSARQIRVVLHPGDAELVRQVYDVGDKELGWKIIEDPVLARGGCRVVTDTSQVDATLESRLAALIAPLLGDQRQDEVDDD